MKKMKIKRRVYEVWMSDQKTQVIVRAPTMEQFTDYLDSFGVIQRIGAAFQTLERSMNGGMDFTNVKISQEDLDEFYPLLSVLSTYRELFVPKGDRIEFSNIDFTGPAQPVTPEDYKGLSVEDGMAIMFAYVQLLAPEKLPNPTKAEAETSPQDMTVPQT